LSEKGWETLTEKGVDFHFRIKDVKEAVQKLKEFGIEIYPDLILQDKFYKMIDEIFGEKLI